MSARPSLGVLSGVVIRSVSIVDITLLLLTFKVASATMDVSPTIAEPPLARCLSPFAEAFWCSPNRAPSDRYKKPVRWRDSPHGQIQILRNRQVHCHLDRLSCTGVH